MIKITVTDEKDSENAIKAFHVVVGQPVMQVVKGIVSVNIVWKDPATGEEVQLVLGA